MIAETAREYANIQSRKVFVGSGKRIYFKKLFEVSPKLSAPANDAAKRGRISSFFRCEMDPIMERFRSDLFRSLTPFPNSIIATGKNHLRFFLFSAFHNLKHEVKHSQRLDHISADFLQAGSHRFHRILETQMTLLARKINCKTINHRRYCQSRRCSG